MRRLAAILGLLALAACGADGPPEPVAGSGVGISGTAKIGVVGKL